MSEGEPTRSEAVSAVVLGIDPGEARIGLAVCPADSRLCLPLRVIEAAGARGAIAEIRAVIRERGVSIVVTGLPVDRNPARVKVVRRFTRLLREGVTGVRWRFSDEHLTTQSAAGLRREAGFSPTREHVDAHAAALILENWFAALRDHEPQEGPTSGTN